MKRFISISLIVICLSALFCSCSITRNRKPKSLAEKIEAKHGRGEKEKKTETAKDKGESRYKGELMKYCDKWIGTPHRMGGITKQGVDCSGFVYNVYKDVYGISLPRRSQDMEKACRTTKSLERAEEGDLVFFNNRPGGSTNHVGIFLDKTKFIHTSTSKGVTISRFDEKYWKERFRCVGKHPKRK